MHIPRELATARRVPPGNYTKPRLYFSIFYKVADKSFEIAARTWETAVENSCEFNKKQGDFFKKKKLWSRPLGRKTQAFKRGI